MPKFRSQFVHAPRRREVWWVRIFRRTPRWVAARQRSNIAGSQQAKEFGRKVSRRLTTS